LSISKAEGECGIITSIIARFNAENPDIHTINQTLFAGPLQDTPNGKRARNTVIVSPGRHDRSPCGTGTCARLAVLHARGQIAEGETFVHESIIGSTFVGRIEGRTKLGNSDAIIPSIEGWARVTGVNTIIIDDRDPFAHGFQVKDSA